MNKRRKRKKRKIESRTPQNQAHVENTSPIAKYVEHAGVLLRSERHTLSQEEDFLNLLHVEKIPGQETAGTIQSAAEKIIKDWELDWEYIKTEKPSIYANTPKYNLSVLYNDFSYKKMGIIRLYKGYYKDPNSKTKNGLFIQDGHHRAVTLACLLLEKKIKWQPIPYWLLSLPENVKVTITS